MNESDNMPTPPYFDEEPRPLAPLVEPKTNGYAIASIIGACVFSALGVIFGHMALAQIRKTDEGGRSLAIAGLTISYCTLVLTAIGMIYLVNLGSHMDPTGYEGGDF